MDGLTLTIGDKNLSSWSLRPWFLMKQAGVPFAEENIRLDGPDTRKILSEKSPSGLVPFLTHGKVQIWDSLAIMEYVAELFPGKSLWPEDAAARAVARSVAAEMHSGFSALRTVWPMVFTREGLRHVTSGGVQRDIDRINDLWTSCRIEYASGGDFLFGEFSIADAMYAPVVSRFVTYGPVNLSPEAAKYREMMFALPAMKEWGEGARTELSTAK
ncbi:glutathione S-transferase family protein [Hyphococcus sp.]|uniref:glutathione S-transferase family protein n=1 Tax=Hyphococcus sp. TaxID=2038636 RepID=UPI003CCBCBFE